MSAQPSLVRHFLRWLTLQYAEPELTDLLFGEFLMVKYLLIYRDSAESKAPPSPEEMQGFLAMWGQWFEKFGPSIVWRRWTLAHRPCAATDGCCQRRPICRSQEMIGGYSVIQAETYEAAVEIARECPISKIGGAIEIRELAGYA